MTFIVHLSTVTAMYERNFLHEINIRTELRPGDIEWVAGRHAELYKKEFDYGIEFANYVREGLQEFSENYDPALDRLWLGEHDDRIVASLFLVHRPENSSQLRYFLIEPDYRGISLGKKLMEMFLAFHHSCGYASCYLWTTNEQEAA